MKVVNITDIEDLILCKHDIDLTLIEHGDIEEKMTIPEFMNKYVNLNNITYIENNNLFSFSIINVYDKEYLLVTEVNNEYINKIKKIIASIDGDFSKLKQLKNIEITEDNWQSMLLYNGKYYQVKV